MRKLLLIFAVLLLTACGSDVPNLITSTEVTKGTLECPTEVVVSTARNELYYYNLGWVSFQDCVEAPDGLMGLEVVEDSHLILFSGGTQIHSTDYGVERPGKGWLKLEWWKYKS